MSRPPSAGIDPLRPNRPGPSTIQTEATSHDLVRSAGPGRVPGKKKKNRNRKKKRTRRQSFAVSADDDGHRLPEASNQERNAARASFYRLKGNQQSNTSLESEALLDHREQTSMKPRRASALQMNAFGHPTYDGPTSSRPQYSNPFSSNEGPSTKRGTSVHNSLDPVTEDGDADENTRLLSGSRTKASYLGNGSGSNQKLNRLGRKNSNSSTSSRKKTTIFDKEAVSNTLQTTSYNVNYPPSVPGSPRLSSSQRALSFKDVLARDDYSSERHDTDHDGSDFDHDIGENAPRSQSSHDSSHRSGFERRATIARAEEDVCFPVEDISEMGDDEVETQRDESEPRKTRRRRRRWPDIAVLDEWSKFEQEGRKEERRAKRMVEPQLIGGRLRPTHNKHWHMAVEEAPYRFTYFNEEFPSTIHSQSISELVQPGGSFRELFIPDPPQLESDSSSDESEDEHPMTETAHLRHSNVGVNGDSRVSTRQTSMKDMDEKPEYTTTDGKTPTRVSTPSGVRSSATNMDGTAQSVNMYDERRESGKNTSACPSSGARSAKEKKSRPKRYGDRPTWWLDVLSPSEQEMKILSKAFMIHPLTSEDILLQETREKVELFRNYYFVNYRTFEQDMNNEDFLEPVNMYIIVFREGVISFHFSLTPHPANVRRRIRQLKDYLILSSDWISYAMIDDITDAFAPLIQNIEDEVDDIDDSILMLHSSAGKDPGPFDEKKSDAGKDETESGGDMLRRVGDCRKKVMGLYRLLGNKADVIKGFAKRCNEHWEVAPRSEIGLYLGDIQDHIVTMTGNLSHYEKILARSHGNYLAQINIRMNERQEQTADVLGKLTVLGTIVLPMNIITGLWGMNVWVPGQDAEGNLIWFWCITAGLLGFGFMCFFMARTFYRIV